MTCLLFVGRLPAAESAQPISAAELPKLTVLPIEDRTEDPDLAFWQDAVTMLVRNRVFVSHQIKGTSERAFTNAWSRLGIEAGDPVSDAQARQFGEWTKSQYVLAGHYERVADQWRITLRLVDSLSETAPEEFSGQASDWIDTVDQAVAEIKRLLNVAILEDDRRKLARQLMMNSPALEWWAKAISAQHDRRPDADVASLVEQALAHDPDCSELQIIFAQYFLVQGEVVRAQKLAHEIVSREPDFAGGHLLMASIVLAAHGDQALAMKHLEFAERVDPTSAEVNLMLARAYETGNRCPEAVEAYKRVLEVNPEYSPALAHLSHCYVKLGEIEKGRQFASEAEKLDPSDEQTLVTLVYAYGLMRNTTKAAQHLEGLRALLKEEEASEGKLQELEEFMDFNKRRLTPSYVSSEKPRRFSNAEVRDHLESMLTNKEMSLMENPLLATPEMKDWAQSIVADEEEDCAKAERIYNHLESRAQAGSPSGIQTAKNIFESWTNAEVSFICQDYAKLYVTLAREVGLEAFYVHLDEDFKGRQVYHDCAAVFFGEKCLLVDPAYRWFGVPHRKFYVLDDIQALAHHAFQPRNDDQDIVRCAAAVKLHPNLAWGRVKFARELIQDGRLVEAARQLDEADTLDPDRWDTWRERGILAANKNQLPIAELALRKSIELNPNNPEPYLTLAQTLFNAKKYVDAKIWAQKALEAREGAMIEMVLQNHAMAREIDWLSASMLGDDSARYFILEAAEAGNPEMLNAMGFINLNQKPKPNIEEAIRWFERASSQGVAIASEALSEIYGKGIGISSDHVTAFRWLLKAAEQGQPSAMDKAAEIYFKGKIVPVDTNQGIHWISRAAEEGYAPSQYRLSLLYYKGEIIPKNYPQAFKWASLAAQSGDGNAKALVAEMNIFMSQEELAEARRIMNAPSEK